MALTGLELVSHPNGLATEFVWLTFRDGDQRYFVRIPQADWDAVVGQVPGDALIQEQEETLAPVIEAKKDRGELAQEPMRNGTVVNRIDLSRTDLEEGIKRTPVPSTGSPHSEWVPEQGGTDALRRARPSLDPIGQANTPLPLRATPQQPTEPQQPTMSPGIVGAQPAPGFAGTETSLPVQSYLVTTPLGLPGGARLVSLTLRFEEGLHNQLPEHMAAALTEEFDGWTRVSTITRSQLLDLLATVSGELNPVLLAAIMDALDNRAATLQFSEPRSFRVRDLLTLATAVTAYSTLGSDALVVVALAGSCFVLIQVFLGVATVANYGVTRIGMALVDRVAEKLRDGAAQRR